MTANQLDLTVSRTQPADHEDASDRTGLIRDRAGLIRDRAGLIRDRAGLIRPGQQARSWSA
ncbi:hypothetical protein [Micromonospora polyrhachis]|uniref:Uncharacterized protein n=1 Tax=Micromonospora polyrhachis TaxID=1282883 RepID=A0A7W7SV65_9ACTN|nr:hypothetical protein [Micromonospora polyrhachis]MBB4961539.1 hypothetical protein [Micromonospora polyrhachis]